MKSINSLELSKKQNLVLDSILGWYKDRKENHITLGGYAGTGKTTLMGYLSNILKKEKENINIAFCSYTGKASRVLQRKLKDTNSINFNDYVGTIHRLIYKPILDDDGEILGWQKQEIEEFEYDLIIVDEASMLNEDIWSDLLSFGKPVLAVGDHGQLPPIEGKFNLMENPILRLEEIYRQELNNPIIQVSQIARKYGNIPIEDFSNLVRKLDKKDVETGEFIQNTLEDFDNQTMILTGYNNSRTKLNEGVRALLNFETKSPTVGDRVICLKNNHSKEIYNGMMGTILEIMQNKVDGLEFFDVEIELDDEDYPYLGSISQEQFGGNRTINNNGSELDLFDFGYALTVHKAQGSQAKRVILFEERFKAMDDEMWRRWLYTGITRAINELYIIGE